MTAISKNTDLLAKLDWKQTIKDIQHYIAETDGVDPIQVTAEYCGKKLRESQERRKREAFDKGFTFLKLGNDYHGETEPRHHVFLSLAHTWKFFKDKSEKWDCQDENSPDKIHSIAIKHGFNFEAAGIRINLPFVHRVTVNVTVPERDLA